MSQASIPDGWAFRIKAATRDLVKVCGQLDRASEIACVSTSTMSRWQGAGSPEVITIAAALALEAECGMPLVTEAMAALHSRALTDSDAQRSSKGTVISHFAAAIAAFGAFTKVGGDAIADSNLTATEIEMMRRALAEIRPVVEQLDCALAAARSPKVVGG